MGCRLAGPEVEHSHCEQLSDIVVSAVPARMMTDDQSRYADDDAVLSVRSQSHRDGN